MRIKKILSLCALAFIGLGSAIGLANEKDAIKVSAEEETSSTSVKVVWKGDEAAPSTLYCYSWNATSGSTNGSWPGTAFSYIEETNSYNVTIPNKVTDGSETDHVIFNNNSGSQTGNLNFSYILKNLSPHQKGTLSFTLKNSSSGTWTGTWYVCNNSEFKYTSDYCKIWLDRKDDLSNDSSYLTPILDYTTSDGKDVSVWPSSYVETYSGSGRYLVGYNVLKDEIKNATYKFTLTDIYWATIKGYTASQTYTSGDNAYLHYFNGYSSGVFTDLTFSKGRAASSQYQLAVSTIIKEVFNGYFTCLSDKDNGYGNFYALKDTWIHGTLDDVDTWWIQGDMDSVAIDDYASSSDYETGEGKTYSTNLWDKYNMMNAGFNSLANASLARTFTINFVNNNGFIFLVIGSIVAVAICLLAIKLFKFRKR
ncbi:MAG: starch-binding protein [Bacilli bacterium]